MARRSLAREVSESVWFRILLILIVTLTCYTQALKAGYIWDDDDYVTNNPHLRTGDGLRQIWFRLNATPQYYPLTFTVFWLVYQIGGLDPFGYHLVTILLHVLTALFAWAVLRRLNVKGAYWAAFVFAVHPVHVESVAWITELKNTLSGWLFLWAVFVYLGMYNRDWSAARRPGSYTKAFGLYLLALFSKTVTCVFPVVMLLIVWWKKGTVTRRDVVYTIPFFVAGLILGLVTVWTEKHHVGALGPAWQQTFVERCLIAGRVVWFYLSKLAVPVDLVFTYPRWEINAGLWWQYLYPAGFAGLLAVLWKGSARWGRGMLAGMIYFVLSLFPALGFFNLFPMQFSFVADHFQYLASIGPIAIAAGLLAVYWEKQPEPWRKRISAGVALILCCLCWLTWRQTRPYKNSMTLFSDVIRRNPTSWMAYNNRGHIFFSEGQLDEAEKDFKEALRLKPDYAEAWNNYGLVLLIKGQVEDAIAYFSRAIEVKPVYPPAYANRGAAYRDLKQYDKARQDLDMAIKMNPLYDEAYNRRGILSAVEEKYAEALEDFNRLLSMNPYFSSGYVNRALVFVEMGEHYSALMDFNRALELDPGIARAYANRAKVLDFFGETERAREDRARAIQLGWKEE